MKERTPIGVDHTARRSDGTRRFAPLLALLVTLVVLEIGLRALVTPSAQSYGRLFGVELAPVALPSPFEDPPVRDRGEPFEDLVVEGDTITIGDLWGIGRPDPLLGYAPQEDTASVNGWWQSNNLGARDRTDTEREAPKGTRRILVFGDSFAAGTRVPQGEVWTVRLEAEADSLVVVNLGVDGYGVGQSYLRYQSVGSAIEHHAVVLMFVPAADLWRDLNTRRDIGGDWPLYQVMPRFVLAGGDSESSEGDLTLVESPFDATRTRGVGLQPANWERDLRDHLRRYDRFYLRSRYETHPVLGRLVLYKIAAAAFSELRIRSLRRGLMEPDSEAVRVTREVVREFEQTVERSGQRFALVILPMPADVSRRRHDDRYWDRWRRMIAAVCVTGVTCVDLGEPMRDASPERIDRGYDGTHYGPEGNTLIADLLRSALSEAWAGSSIVR